MKHLPKETCEYLVYLGCTSESGWVHRGFFDAYDGMSGYAWKLIESGQCKSREVTEGDTVTESQKCIPAFSLEDILRKDNAEKIYKALPEESKNSKERYSRFELVERFASQVYEHPDTWPEEVAHLILPDGRP